MAGPRRATSYCTSWLGWMFRPSTSSARPGAGVRSPRTRNSLSAGAKRTTGANAVPWDGWYGVPVLEISSKTRSCWSAEGRDKEGTPVRRGSITIESTKTLTTPSEFAARVERERGAASSARRARPIHLDLSPTSTFPMRFRSSTAAKQHLSDVSKSIYGAGTVLAQQWACERHEVAGDRRHPRRPTTTLAQDDEALHRLRQRNQERMR